MATDPTTGEGPPSSGSGLVNQWTLVAGFLLIGFAVLVGCLTIAIGVGLREPPVMIAGGGIFVGAIGTAVVIERRILADGLV